MTATGSGNRRALALRFGLSLLSGVLLFLSVPGFGLWPLIFVALIPQLWVARAAATPRRAFLFGWLTGTVANAGGFYWMDFLLERFGHMPAVEALPIMLLLVAYQGLAFGVFSWLIRRTVDRTGRKLALLAPLAMVAIELILPQIFPYYLAIAVAFVPRLIQVADLTGPLGVTALLLAFNGAAADLLRDRRAWRGLAVAGALLVADLGYGTLRMHQADARRAAAPKVRTGLVQANVGILEKWDPAEFARLLTLHQQASADLTRNGAQLIIWPESSYPYALPRDFAHDFPPEDPRRIRRGFDTPLLFGAVTVADRSARRGPDRYPYNTALMMDGAGNVTGKFDKVFLMLFGEYIPYYDAIPWFTEIFPEACNFSRGSQPAAFPLRTDTPGTLGGFPNPPATAPLGEAQLRQRAAGDFKLGPLICYEDILPTWARRVGRLDPSAFVNITNDAWFGRTAEPKQHLALAVFRSVEHRLEMVRAVNTGVSAHVDAAGRVLAETESVDPAVQPVPPKTLLVELAMLPGGGLYRAVGDLFGFACLAALGFLWWRAPRPAQGRRKKNR